MLSNRTSGVWLGAKEITKCNSLIPQTASIWDQVEMVRTKCKTRFAKPVHDVGAVGSVLVSHISETVDGFTRAVRLSTAAMMSIMGFAASLATAVAELFRP